MDAIVSDRELVIKSMEELCRKTGFDDPSNMVQRNLEFLAETIETKTGVLISLSTIKRLMNGNFSRQPQIATLNAIALSLGFDNWHSYKLNQSPKPFHTTPDENELHKSPLRRNFKPLYRRYLAVGGIAVLTTICLLTILKFQKPGLGNIASARFSAHKTTSNDLPNTVIFKFNIDDVMADSFFIQQSWDKHRKVRIYKNSYTLTDIYYEPGYHKAKLFANDRIIKTVDVSIPTDRWFFYAKEKVPKALPRYIQTANAVRNGSLQLSLQEVIDSEVDIKRQNEYLQVYFPGKIESTSDNFIMKFRVKVNPVTNNFCPYFMAEVFCQKNFMYFTSMPKGCASDIITQFGENFASGKKNDFSGLASDPKTWQEVELTVQDKNVTIRINSKKVFSTSYQESAGLITGIGFISNGLVEVDFVNLKTPDGKEIFDDDFERSTASE